MSFQPANADVHPAARRGECVQCGAHLIERGGVLACSSCGFPATGEAPERRPAPTREERQGEELGRLRESLAAERRLRGEHERTIRELTERVAALEVLAGAAEAERTEKARSITGDLAPEPETHARRKRG